MCSLNDNDFDSDIQTMECSESNDILDEVKCQKCNDNNATIKLRGKDVYCKLCFNINVTHKFRAILGKSKIVRPNDKILIAHSGNEKSTVLLHLIKCGMNESVHKRLMFTSNIIYIDDGIINKYNIDERQLIIDNIKQQIKSIDFHTLIVPLSECLNENKNVNIININDYSCTINNINDNKLIDIFNNLTCDTSRDDLLKKLRTRVIIRAAKLLDCKKIFFADDSTSLSVSILTDVSLGRGAQLPYDVGFIDNRYGNDLIIMRPLRDFSRHEVNYYLNIHNLKIIKSNKLVSKVNSYKSIRQLTQQFIIDLDKQFNGTVSTIYRVSEKVSGIANNSIDNNNELCILCYTPLDTCNLNGTISAIDAIQFSKLISTGNRSNIDDNNINICYDNTIKHSKIDNCCGDCGKTNCTIEKDNDKLLFDNVSQCLCYGCRLIFNNNYNNASLPKFLINAAKEKLCFIKMRKQIKNFLL